jgi:hypothetical protein
MADSNGDRGPAHSSQNVNSEPPSKRQRLSQEQTTTHPKMAESLGQDAQDNSTEVDIKKETIFEIKAVDTKFNPDSREAEAGILHFVNDNGLGFSGTLKQRYVASSIYYSNSLNYFVVLSYVDQNSIWTWFSVEISDLITSVFSELREFPDHIHAFHSPSNLSRDGSTNIIKLLDIQISLSTKLLLMELSFTLQTTNHRHSTRILMRYV